MFAFITTLPRACAAPTRCSTNQHTCDRRALLQTAALSVVGLFSVRPRPAEAIDFPTFKPSLPTISLPIGSKSEPDVPAVVKKPNQMVKDVDTPMDFDTSSLEERLAKRSKAVRK